MKNPLISITISAAALLGTTHAIADTFSTSADLLLNWAEAIYPSLLTSSRSSQVIVADGTEYYYRGPYEVAGGTLFYAGVSISGEPKVAILDTAHQDGIVEMGDLSAWLASVGVATTPSGMEVTSCTASERLDGGENTLADLSFYAEATDTSGVCAMGGGVLTLIDPVILTVGNSSSLENSSFFGLNAGVLAVGGSNITLSGGSIMTSGSGANGAFATGVGSSVSLQDVTIQATGAGAHGVDATLGGSLALMNVTASSTGNNGSVIATDRGSGTITVSGGSFSASGVDSAGVYSTGVITVAGATIHAENAEAVVIEGGNSALMTNCEMSAGKGTRDRGMFVYQSMSGDASQGSGHLIINGGSYTWPSETGPAFYVTNTTATISLTGVEIANSSGVLLKASADNWGMSGSNGGNVAFYATAQVLEGDVVADAISTIAVSLSDGSAFTGAIDSANTARAATLALDVDSTWSVSADSHLTGLTVTADAGVDALSNIISNGHDVYYQADAAENAWLAGANYALPGGGMLVAE